MVLAAILVGVWSPVSAQTASALPANGDSRMAASAEDQQAFVDRYAPIVVLRQQTGACDQNGEGYAPSPVEVVLGDPAVTLQRRDAHDTVITTAPVAADLFQGGSDLYLNLPGNPLAPGCDYEQYYRQRMDALGQPPVTYARIVVNAERDQIALEYWFYYPFNDWNNTHESDWEDVILFFQADNLADAMRTGPTRTAYAQHSGGELAAWQSNKLQKDGDHPLVYVARGSHGSYYGAAVYIGWGEGGTGFGCDDASPPGRVVPLQARLIPDGPVTADSPFAWITYQGSWGQREAWEYDGSTGPNTTTQWDDPFRWSTRLRSTSIRVPTTKILGPSPTRLFCAAVAGGSSLLALQHLHPLRVDGFLLALVVGFIALISVTGPTLLTAARLYRRRWPLFAGIGLVLVPLGIVANGLEDLLTAVPPGRILLAVMNNAPVGRLAIAAGVGSLQEFLGLTIVAPAVIVAVTAMRHGERIALRGAYGAILGRMIPLLRARLRVAGIVLLLGATVVGLPFAVYRLVCWLFVPQVVMLEPSPSPAALARSQNLVAGHWWRIAADALMLTMIANLPGPIVGMLLLVFASRSVDFVNALSSLIYALTLPFAVIGFTLLYEASRHRTHDAPLPRSPDG